MALSASQRLIQARRQRARNLARRRVSGAAVSASEARALQRPISSRRKVGGSVRVQRARISAAVAKSRASKAAEAARPSRVIGGLAKKAAKGALLGAGGLAVRQGARFGRAVGSRIRKRR